LQDVGGGEVGLDVLKSVPLDLLEPKLSNALALGEECQCGKPTVAAKVYIERGEHERGLCTSASAIGSPSGVEIWGIKKITSLV